MSNSLESGLEQLRHANRESAAPQGAKSLSEIKDSTKLGYGFYTVDGSGEGLAQTFASLIAG